MYLKKYFYSKILGDLKSGIFIIHGLDIMPIFLLLTVYIYLLMNLVLFLLITQVFFTNSLLFIKKASWNKVIQFYGLVTFLSFAGVPPFAGFFGKFYFFCYFTSYQYFYQLIGFCLLNFFNFYFYTNYLKYFTRSYHFIWRNEMCFTNPLLLSSFLLILLFLNLNSYFFIDVVVFFFFFFHILF